MTTPIIDALMARGTNRPLIQQRVPRSPDVAQALMARGMDLQGVDSPMEALGHLAQTWAGNRLQDRYQQDQDRQQDEHLTQLSAVARSLMGDDPRYEAALNSGNPDILQALIGQGLEPEPAPPGPTDDMQEYEYARQNGFTGTFTEWQMMRPPTTQNTINMPGQPTFGPVSSGYARIPNPKSPTGHQLVQEPGGAPAADAALAAEAAAGRENAQQIGATIVTQDIDRALDAIDANPTMTTGLIGQLTQGVPWLPGGSVAALIDTVRANIGFDKLQAMREASPTGGALGQVTERELGFLQAALGNLAVSQNYTQLRDNLARVKNIYLDVIHGEGQGPPREPLGFMGQGEGGQQPQINAAQPQGMRDPAQTGLIPVEELTVQGYTETFNAALAQGMTPEQAIQAIASQFGLTPDQLFERLRALGAM